MHFDSLEILFSKPFFPFIELSLENPHVRCLYFTDSPLLHSEIESYTIVKSLLRNQDHAVFYQGCREREFDADEETGKQNINLEGILGHELCTVRSFDDVVGGAEAGKAEEETFM
jgi:hypothetical protein